MEVWEKTLEDGTILRAIASATQYSVVDGQKTVVSVILNGVFMSAEAATADGWSVYGILSIIPT